MMTTTLSVNLDKISHTANIGIVVLLVAAGLAGHFVSFYGTVISTDSVGGNDGTAFFGGKTDSSPPIRGGHRLSPHLRRLMSGARLHPQPR